MSWILKIIQGPNDGAEIELPDGQVTRLGRGDSCDVMLLDAMMADVAMELDCKGEQVTLTPLADGCYLGEKALLRDHAEALPAFTVVTCGDTRLAVGPSDRPWPELTWPDLQALRLAALPPLSEQELLEIAEQARARALAKEQEAQEALHGEAALEEEKQAKTARQAKFRRFWRAVFRWFLYLLIALVVLLCMWVGYRYVFELTAPPLDNTSEVQTIRERELDKLIEKHQLVLTQSRDKDRRLLRGNVSTGQERSRVEQAASLAFPGIRLELSDDETLRDGVQAVLNGLAEKTLVIEQARHGVVRIIGMVAVENDWRTVEATLKSDVPMLKKLESQVIVSANVIPELNARLLGLSQGRLGVLGGKGQLQLVGELREDERPLLEKILAELKKMLPRNVAVVSSLKWLPKPRPAEAKKSVPAEVQPPVHVPVQTAPAKTAKAPERKPTQQELDMAQLGRLPVAGIMVMPFASLVLADGSRCGEGGVVEGFTVVKITATQVIFRKGENTYTWQP